MGLGPRGHEGGRPPAADDPAEPRLRPAAAGHPAGPPPPAGGAAPDDQAERDARLRRRPSVDRLSPGAMPLVSVVIPVRDDPAGVAAVIAALGRQTLSREQFEVTVAVDGGEPPPVPAWVKLDAGPPRN